MRKFYQGISLDDMYTYHQDNANAVFKKGGGSDVQLSAVGKMCVGTAKTNQASHIIMILLKI